MNSGLLKHDTVRLGRPVPRQTVSDDPDAIELRALGRVFARRWKLLLGSAIWAGVLAYVVVSLMAPSYTAVAKVILDPRQAQIIAGGEVFADIEPSVQVVNGEIAILRSNVLLEEVINSMSPDILAPIDPGPGDGSAASATNRMETLVWMIRENLSVYAQSDSYVIVAEYTSPDPRLSYEFTNTLIDRYISRQIEGRRESVEQATVWLEDRLEVLGAEVAAKEETIAMMRTDSLLENGGALDNAAQQVTELNNELVVASSARLAAEAQVQLLDRLLAEDSIDEAVNVVSSETIDTLRAQAVEIRRQDAVWAETVDADHPRRAPLQRELARIQGEIAAEVENVREVRRSEAEVARFRELSLQESIVQMEQRVLQISRGEIGLRQLEREATAARSIYEALLTRLTETRTQQRLQQADAKLIEHASLPTSPSAPRPKLMAAMAATLALSVAAIMVFFNEMTSATFRSARDVLKETGLPVVATLPAARWSTLKNGLKDLRKNAYSPYAERIRQLRNTVLMRDETKISESLMILSSAPGEGKTMTTVALAEMAAKVGKSVIVVDCDLRRSTLHATFRWKMKRDLADYLTAQCDLREAIHSPADWPFDVLVANGTRPDIAEELSGSWLRPMIDELKTIYDVVLIDGPALLAVADAIIVAGVADARLYLIEHDKTERSEVAEGLAMINEMGLGLEGVILNKAPANRRGSYTYD